MSSDGRSLLLRLEPAVRPTDVVRAGGESPRSTLDAQPFAELLRQARAGGIASERIPDASLLGEALPPEAMSRIAKALDMLQAHGSDRAVVVYDRRTLVADVASRTIEGELLAHEGPQPAAIDAAVRVPTPEEERPGVIPGPPRAVHVPQSVLELLEARDSQS